MNRSPVVWLGLPIVLAAISLFFVARKPDVEAPVERVLSETKRVDKTGPTVDPTPPQVSNASLISIPEPFIGTEACAKCHADRHQSYLKTHHSRSLSLVGAGHSEKTGAYFHDPSQTLYEVLVHENGITHRESLRVPTSPTTNVSFPASELPVKYVMGSGAFAKGYLLEDSGFLVQSPVTWYRKPDNYSMAPGYDVKDHLGTTRVIDEQCMFCHAGIISRVNNNDQQLIVHELSIGCERCHGAGAEHARLYETKPAVGSVADSKIVNPANLERIENESICAQCHLQGDIVVNAKGKSIWDFAPGTRLDETRKTYKIDGKIALNNAKQEDKTFVDHFDQLWQSECYKQTDTLTCITCHDPHHTETARPVSLVQTEHCMKCHTDESCGLDHDVRVEREQNVCYRCHMPQVASEVPHAATTNHQIAIYPRSGSEVATSKTTEPLLRQLRSPKNEDQSIERSDIIAAAFSELDGHANAASPKQLSKATRDSLKQLVSRDKADAVLHSILSRGYRAAAEAATDATKDANSVSVDWSLAEQEALETIRLEPRPVELRKHALDVLLAKAFDSGQFDVASRCGVELVQTRRSSKDAYNTALALARVQQTQQAESLLRESIRIDVRYDRPYQSLFKLYSPLDPNLAEQIRQAGMMLEVWETAKNSASE